MVIVVTRRVPMTRGASLRSRVKGNFQARFWSSGGRGDSPTDCRKLSGAILPLQLTPRSAAIVRPLAATGKKAGKGRATRLRTLPGRLHMAQSRQTAGSG